MNYHHVLQNMTSIHNYTPLPRADFYIKVKKINIYRLTDCKGDLFVRSTLRIRFDTQSTTNQNYISLQNVGMPS